jgi:hypothetical protein
LSTVDAWGGFGGVHANQLPVEQLDALALEYAQLDQLVVLDRRSGRIGIPNGSAMVSPRL